MEQAESRGRRPFRFCVVTPSRKLVDEDAWAAVLPAFDGELGVLPGHAPLMALLGEGAVRVERTDGARQYVAVRGGIAEITPGRVTVLTPEAALPQALSAEQIDAEMAQLLTEPSGNGAARAVREAGIRWAKARRRALSGGGGR